MPKVHYTLFVDESGDQDLDKFRTDERQCGSDPYLVFGGVLIPTKHLDDYRAFLNELRAELDVKALHCTDALAFKAMLFCTASNEP